MGNWLNEWAAAGQHAAERANTSKHTCGASMVVGYSNLGIPLVACPKCQPDLVANGKRACGDVWGLREAE